MSVSLIFIEIVCGWGDFFNAFIPMRNDQKMYVSLAIALNGIFIVFF